jgi:CHAD domain-containing protein
MTQTLERELKFEAPMSAALPDLRDVVGRTKRLPHQPLHTMYYDTADGRLWERGLTLRHRTIGGEGPGTWTLKLPHRGNGSALERTELSWPGRSDDPPATVLDIVRGLVRREPLHRLVALETLRQRLTVTDATGRPVAELDDDVVHVQGGPRAGWQFRQVELELHGASKRVVRTAKARLQEAGLIAEEQEKLGKAMGFSHPSPASHRLAKTSPLRDVVAAALTAGLDRLLDHDVRLRCPVHMMDKEDVHRARVATRRLRADVKTFGVVLDPVWVEHVRSDLKWVGSALGEVRDVDVLAETLQDAPKELLDDLSEQRAAAARRLSNVLDSDRYLRTLDRLHGASRTPPFVDTFGAVRASDRATKVLPTLVAERWKALRRQVRRSGHQPTDRQLHRTRIKAKQLRYAAEAASRVSGKPAKRLAERAEEIQTILGRHHDAVAAQAWLEESAGRAASATAFEAGRLARRQQKCASRQARQWRRSWRALEKSKAPAWLH